MRLQGKVAIVTGGARGMGEATVRIMVEEGAKVLIGDLLEAEGQALAQELGDSAAFMRMDVTNKADWEAAVAAARELGPLSVLVNNAAIVMQKTILDTTEEDFMNITRINQLSVFLGMQSVFESLKENGGGSIINISSIDGLQSKNSLTAYSGTKWAVRGMTKTAAVEFARKGIRVNSIHPGLIETPMAAEVGPGQERLIKRTPLGRSADAREVANMALFLASDESSYSTGSEFLIDGGLNAL